VSGADCLRCRLKGRLRFRQRVRLRFPAVCSLLADFPRSRAVFAGESTGDISVSASESRVSRPLTGDSLGLCPVVHDFALRLPLAARLAAFSAVRSFLSLLVAWPLPWMVSSAHRVVASRRRCFAALARLVKPVAFPLLRCLANRGCNGQPSLSLRLPGRWCNCPRAARRRSGGAL
jgi:hypothetical protein